MIPVEQRTLGGDSTMATRGDCLKCCVASILELDYDDVPHFIEQDDWYGAFNRFVEARGFRLGNAFHTFDADEPTKLNGHPSDGIYWLASVYSPRLTHDDGSPGQHMIVMCGGEVAWDPHPQRGMGHLGFVGIGYTFVAPDPARLVLREELTVPERIDDPLPEDLERVLRDPEIAIPGDEAVAEIFVGYLRDNPEVTTVRRDIYLRLWAMYERERRAA